MSSIRSTTIADVLTPSGMSYEPFSITALASSKLRPGVMLPAATPDNTEIAPNRQEIVVPVSRPIMNRHRTAFTRTWSPTATIARPKSVA